MLSDCGGPNDEKTAVPALLLASLPALAKEDVLHLYNWNDYIAPETVERFEKFCSCKVKQSYFSDNEELMAKLSAGAKGYDVMVPTSNYVAGHGQAGLAAAARPRPRCRISRTSCRSI